MTDYFAKENLPSHWQELADIEHVRGWLGQTRLCPACGRMHGIQTRMIEQAPDMAHNISLYLATLGFKGRCLVVMDKNTRQAAGLSLLEGLAPYRPRAAVFSRDDLHADEQALGTLLAELADKPDFLVACGSGTLTDITRYNSFMTGIPFVSFATAASVDGFASGSTPLVIRGFKKTYPGVAPDGIFYDPAILAAAPAKMTAAGFGDVLAKIIALLDWRLAYVAEDEDYCPLIAAMVDRAVQDCLALAKDLAVDQGETPAAADSRPEPGGSAQTGPTHAASAQTALARKGEACARLMETLSLTGVAMQMMKSSRPASGSDHQISHLLEMRDIQQHRSGSLHGDKVGIGALIGMTLYLRLFKGRQLPGQRPILSAERWQAEVRRVYGPLAEQALAINPAEPPQGELWERQKRQIGLAMEQYGYDIVDSFQTLLPEARDKILAMGGPVRPDQLGYSVQDTYDAIAFGKENRPKFTTLRLAERFGYLYDLAEEIAAGLPEGKIY